MVLELVVLLSLGAVVYSYLLYPIVLALVAAVVQAARDARFVFSKHERRRESTDELPRVAILIAACNEERHIAARIENLLQLDYPPHLWRAYIGSDGSTDRTAALLSACADTRIVPMVFASNRGKASVLNDLAQAAEEPVLVFSDANTAFDRMALRRLVAPFEAQRTGGVCGELRLRGVSGDNQDSLYWRLEQYLKFCEGRIGGLLGANGGIYAIRRSLWQRLRADTICDDFCVAMNVAAAGQRLVYEPNAWAEEEAPASIAEEHRRRLRIGIGNFQALLRHPEYVLRTSWTTAFTYVSHKVLRWLAPHLLIIGLLASMALGVDSTVWRAFAAAQLAAYLSAALLYGMSGRGWRLPVVLKIAAFLFALHWAFLEASLRFASGRYRGSWRPTARE